MKNWRKIPIPQLMLDKCEFDPRGLPVPYIVLKDKHGKHHFKINDQEKTIKCMMKQLCTICGTYMNPNDRWMVGGPASAFDERGYYIDHPIHKECGVYALQVCPYMAFSGYDSKIDISKLMAKFEDHPGLILNNPTIDPDRLPLFVFIRPTNITYNVAVNDIKIKVIPPHEIEFWNDGERITSMKRVKDKLVGTKWEKYLKNIFNEAEVS